MRSSISILDWHISLSHCRICMTYTVSEDILRLSCKVDNLEFKVLFSDPHNNEQAFCLLSYPTVLCHHHYSNSSINQNLSTNETVFTIRGKINANVNGKWLCRHGNRFERATVDIKFDAVSDIKGLDITANQTLPFVDGATVEITCAAQITGRFAKLTWDCSNATAAKNSILNCSTVLSKISYKASVVHNGSFCRCIAKIGRFVTSTSINLNIQANFELHLIEHVRCNSSTPVSIYCKINKRQAKSGFAPWIHSFNGIFIRYLKGDQNDTCSIISIDSCALEDTGQYFCRAWVKELSQIIWKNKTTSLIINGRYYAAPGSSNQPNVYNDIQIPVVEESHDHQYSDIENEQIETDKDSSESGWSLSQAHYMEVDSMI
ncbi:unnamed protein product [Mytilus coruscus]|uniref:Ig-like domain-containing protein n=1 Tax=Mytilus coruscus TaxID=42192 RepID=A0A6J8EQD5_MYTCO|nr:unnamed protein product [Mytilus coruscus]